MKTSDIIKLYDDRVDTYGPCAQAAGWRDESQQIFRFKLLTEHLEICQSTTVLDIGTGYAALTQYLIQNYRLFMPENFTGIDISSKMISKATENHPKSKFLVSDYESYDMATHDIVMMSGALNIKTNISPEIRLRKFIDRALLLSNKYVVFNLLNDRVDFKEDHFEYYNINMVLNLITRQRSKFLAKSSYPLWEDTFIIYK
jgi:SAM-dependent methyltransferase